MFTLEERRMTNIIDKIRQAKREVKPKPEIFVGQGATYTPYTDKIPLTITKVEGEAGKRKVTLRECKATPTKNYDYYKNQSYIYTDVPEGREFYFQEKDEITNQYGDADFKVFKESNLNDDTGRLNKAKGTGGLIYVGFRKKWVDPSF
tara:strand:+ start:217 stop:660 length:444 start_codon:yes stop_codon:yes gene_type:complete